ncbi:mutS domain II family protein, partial [Chlamydia psittaci 02DC22]
PTCYHGTNGFVYSCEICPYWYD